MLLTIVFIVAVVGMMCHELGVTDKIISRIQLHILYIQIACQLRRIDKQLNRSRK